MPSPPPHQQPNRRPYRAASLACLAAALVAGVAAAERFDPDGALAAQSPTALPTATATPWAPSGTWAPVHAPGVTALWPGATVPALRAVHGMELLDGTWDAWAVGEKCLMAHFDGATWSPVTALDHRCGANAWLDLRDVFVKAPDEVWAVGRIADDRDCKPAGPADANDVGYEEGCGFVAHYDGAQWRVLTAQEVGVAGRLSPMNALDMAYDPARGEWVGWAVGNDADFDNIKAMVLSYVPARPGWDDAYAATNLIADLRDVKVLSYDESWAVGEDGTESRFFRNAQGNATWRRNPLSGREHLYTVDLADPEYGWDGGWKGRMHHYDGNCHDDDDTTPCWFDNADRPVFGLDGVPMTAELYGIDLLARGIGWLVGSRTSGASTIAHADDAHWKQATIQDDPVVDLYGVFMRDVRGGWAVGGKGVILAYADDTAPTEPPTATATATEEPSATLEPSVTPEPTTTLEPSATADPTLAATDAPTPDATDTPTETATATGESTPPVATPVVPVRPIYLPVGWRVRS